MEPVPSQQRARGRQVKAEDGSGSDTVHAENEQMGDGVTEDARGHFWGYLAVQEGPMAQGY